MANAQLQANEALLSTIRRLNINDERDNWVGEDGKWVMKETLGQGATGIVKRAELRQGVSDPVAIKVVDRSYMATNPMEKKRIDREIEILKLIKHPYVMELIEVIEGRDHRFLVLEFLEGGELYDKLLRKQRLPMEEVFKYFFQLTMAVSFMHRNNVVHRDIKLENMIIDKATGDVKLADFGMATVCKPGTKLTESVGSPHYACPEIMKGEKYVGYEADMWSMGVVFFVMLTGTLPFDADTPEMLAAKVKEGEINYPPSLPDSAVDLLKRMLQPRGEDRCTIKDIQEHGWWKSRCSRITPKMRKIWDQEFPADQNGR